MKMLYTSNYARQGQNPKAYAVSVKPPDWYEGKTLPLLAPTWDIVSGIQKGVFTYDDYREEYLRLLEDRNKNNKVTDLIKSLPEGSFLLCYEPPNEFCHRHILGQWILHNCAIYVEEWKNEEEVKKELQQLSVDSLLDF